MRHYGIFVESCVLFDAEFATINQLNLTRKLSYRKDDRAMRPVYGWPENFRVSLTTATATFPEIVDGLLFRLSL